MEINTGNQDHLGVLGGHLFKMALTDGNTTVTVAATDPLGSPHRPLTAAQCETKFRDCAANAIRPLDPAAVTAAIAAIGRLDALPDATAWFAAFA